jgi:hypothetical protein
LRFIGLLLRFLEPSNEAVSGRCDYCKTKEACLPAAGRDVDDWRRGETNHPAADFAAKERWIGIDTHRLKVPIGLVKDWKVLRRQIDSFLNDVIG